MKAKNIIRPLIIALLLVAVVIGTSFVPNPTSPTLKKIKDVLTVGFAGEVYAAAPDYEVDGTADNVQVQAAVDALPSTGGKVILYGGNYTFAATVSRAIDNVIIEGSGVSTYVAYNASTALFSAGSQSGWVFRDLKTDAGGITVSSATKWTYQNVTINANYYVLYTDRTQGTTFPANPYTGEQFLHKPTGRAILYQYDGSAWQPIEGYGTMTLYVDNTDGTDDKDHHGTAADASAFKTIQYAFDCIPPIYNGNITININSETYTESPILRDKRPAGNYTITINGVLALHDDLISSGNGVKGATSTQASWTDTGLTDHHYNYQLLKFTSGSNNDLYRVITHNDTTSITLAGKTLSAQPVNLDTASVYNWGTTISGVLTIANIKNLTINDLKISSTTDYALVHKINAETTCNRCYFTFTTGGGVMNSLWSKITLNNCMAYTSTSAFLLPYYNCDYSEMYLVGSVSVGITAQTYHVYNDQGSTALLQGGCVMDTGYAGLYVQVGSMGVCYATDVYNFLNNQSGYGVYAIRHGQVIFTAYNSYSGDGTNESAESASYSYVD